MGRQGSATVNFDRSFRALSKREDSRPCASAQGRDGKEDEGGGEGEGRSTLRGSPALLKLRRGKLRGGFDFVRTVISYENNCQGPIAERCRWLRKQVMSISYPRSGTFVARALYNASAGVLPHCRIR